MDWLRDNSVLIVRHINLFGQTPLPQIGKTICGLGFGHCGQKHHSKNGKMAITTSSNSINVKAASLMRARYEFFEQIAPNF